MEAYRQFLALLLENYIHDANYQMANAIYPLQIRFLSTYLMKHSLQEYLSVIKREHVFTEGKLVKVNERMLKCFSSTLHAHTCTHKHKHTWVKMPISDT